MKNLSFFPFERNRYYSGKLLTSEDFETEQSYLNNKRRFLNHALFGGGIVCGLAVGSAEGGLLTVGAGAALDRCGREIVVEENLLKKLSSIEGFDTISGTRASLRIAYAEQPVRPAYSIESGETGQEYEFNHIREGYRLFLAEPAGNERREPPALVARHALFENSDFAVYASFPAQIPHTGGALFRLEIEKRSNAPRIFCVDAALQIPAFTAEDGRRELHAAFDGVLLDKGRRVFRDFPLYPAPESGPKSGILIKSAFVRLSSDGTPLKMPEDVLLPVEIVPDSPEEIIAMQLGRTAQKELLGALEEDSSVELCGLLLLRTESSCLIERILHPHACAYLRCPSGNSAERECLARFLPPRTEQQAPPDNREAALPAPAEAGSERLPVASGVCEIPLGPNARTGTIFYSDEIMHGLGAGHVFVACGLEYAAEEDSGTVYGDARLFRKSKNSGLPRLATAVKVLAERGTFVAAAELLEPTGQLTVRLRWHAMRPRTEGVNGIPARFGDARIRAVPSTIVLGFLESFAVEVQFQNMKPSTLHYELTDSDSGSVSPAGIYTAPSREGVFEIRISCAENPFLSAYAYAVVKKKGPDDGCTS